MDPELVQTCFFLGVIVAEHVHRIRRMPKDPTEDAIFDTLKAVADGSLTLIDTPEEAVAELPEPPPQFAPHLVPLFRAMMRNGRENQRIAAQAILAALPPGVREKRR
jgi:hypothetical protein